MNRISSILRRLERLDAAHATFGDANDRASRITEMETDGMTEDEIDRLVADRVALLDEIDAKIGKATP